MAFLLPTSTESGGIALEAQSASSTATTSSTDTTLANIIFGWVLGFLMLNTVTAYRQTTRWTVYIVLCWTVIVCLTAMITIEWCFFMGYASLGVLISVVFLWAVKLHCLAQIIVNRICILLHNESQRTRLKVLVAVIILVINFAVFAIWIPAQLGVSQTLRLVNKWFDRVEKVIILILDVVLNWYFIKVVKARLLSLGLTKYDTLVSFNLRIIVVSIAMDAMIIGFMSYPNPLIYTMLHPVAYSVKLQIEMTMAKLIIKVARASEGGHSTGGQSSSGKLDMDPRSNATSSATRRRDTITKHQQTEINVTVSRVIVEEDNISGKQVDLISESSGRATPIEEEDDSKSKPIGQHDSFIEMTTFAHDDQPRTDAPRVYFSQVGRHSTTV